jgi:hypothetical protein
MTISKGDLMSSSLILYILLYVLVGVVFGSYTMRVADAKGYSSGSWFAGGFFFNLIAAAGLPPGSGHINNPIPESPSEPDTTESVQEYLSRMAAEKAARQSDQSPKTE